ncbi:MAG: DUF4410 domain-containing protein [Alphaproteobacteria bacterium]|jgi:hypothetical protein|nr:DUF4410 domain-containing protein [Alphaproteobacteria bacterium]
MLRLVLALLLFAGPALAETHPDWAAPAGSGSPPDRVIVQDFAIAPEDVKLDDGVVASIRRERPRLLGMLNNQPSTDEQQLGIARSIADVFAIDLVEALQARSLRASRAGVAPATTPATLFVQGHFTALDEGSKAQRLAVGFGVGASRVDAEVQLIQNGAVLAQFAIEATSGHKPGSLAALARGPAALAAAGGVRAVLEQTNPTLAKDVKAAAGKVADRIAATGQAQGWLKP